jgi:hypothetical protein
MAKKKSIPSSDQVETTSPILKAKGLISECYDTLLELDSMLKCFDDQDTPPPWVHFVSRSVSRALNKADLAYVETLRVPGGMGD